MNPINKKIIIKLILVCFIAAISPYANPQLKFTPVHATPPVPNSHDIDPNLNPFLEEINQNTTIDQFSANDTIINSLDIIQDEIETPNITDKFRDWAKEIQTLEENLNTVVYDEIEKVDTLIETQRVIDLNNEIFTKAKAKVDEIKNLSKNDYNSNEDAWAQHIYDHYLEQSQNLAELFNFNQVFECLMIKAEIGAEINGDMLSHKEFISKAIGEGLIACPPGPNALKGSDPQQNNDARVDNPDINIAFNTDTSRQILQNNFTTEPSTTSTNGNNKLAQYLGITKTYASLSTPPAPELNPPENNPQTINNDSIAPYFENPDTNSPEFQQLQNEINNIPEPKSGNPPTQEFFPPPLEFENPAEVKVLLPQTIAEFNSYYKQGIQVDERIYYLLYHVFQTMEMNGETYERYLADKVIQDATTPGAIKTACGKNIENSPEKCDNPANLCGIVSATYFVFDVMTGNIDNLGVPYKDRAHLKIWLGLNAPYASDEIGEDELEVVNPHYDLKAVDISEIGLYNESTDCSACGDIVSCKSITAVVDSLISAYLMTVAGPMAASQYSLGAATENNVPFWNIYRNSAICMLLCTAPIFWGTLCQPCCPPILDSANPNTMGVKVKWQNEDYGSIASDLAGAALDQALPFDPENGFSITNMLKGLAQGAIEQLFNSGFKNFDVAKLAQGGFENFMSEMGNQWLDEKVFGKLGLPDGFSSSVNWLNPNPEALITSITGNYLDEQLGLEFGSFTPIISAMMSGDFKDAALSALNFTPNLNLPPKLQEAMNIAIQNGDNPEAMGLAFANLGLKELNSNVLGWPDGILDLDSFSGEGFIGIANKLGQHGLAKIEGLPTNFIFDIKNPKNTAMSLTSSLLSDVTDNQRINQALTTAISQGQDFSLNSAMQLMETEDLSKIFAINTEDAQFIKDFVDNPTSMPFVTFKNTLLNKIDFEQAALKNINFTPESLELLVDYGLNPAYSGDNAQAGQLMMAAISNSIKLDKFGIDLNKTDIEKLAYLQDYIQIVNNLPESTNPAFNNYSPYGYGYNPYAYSPELQKLSQDYSTKFGNSEPITQFHDRIVSTIDQSISDPNSDSAKAKNEISYLVAPIKISFSERVKKDELSQIDYIDTTTKPGQNGASDTQFQGVLRSLNVDLNSLEIVHSTTFEQKNNALLSPDQNTTNPDYFSSYGGTSFPSPINATYSEYFEPGEIYYAYPKVDLAEIALPGIRGNNNYHSQTGNFKLLSTTTNIIKYAQEKPIVITPITSNNQQIPGINQNLPSNIYNRITPTLPNTTSGFSQIQNILSQDPLKTAFLEKHQFSYQLPDSTYATFDNNAFLGGSGTIYNTLNSIGKSDNQAKENLSNLGVTVIAASMTGIDIASMFTDVSDQAILENKLTQLTNAMGIVKSWQTGDIETGIKSMTGFLKDNGVFDNLSNNSTWNIGPDGNIAINGVDPLKIYSDIESGNYFALLEDIPLIQDKFNINNEIRDAIGTGPEQLLDLVQNFSPQKASDTVMEIMANKITSESGLEKLAVVQELTNTLGVPPDPKNIPKLLQSDFIQKNVLQDIDPGTLGDISSIYGLVASGDITPQKAVSTIMTANFFQDAIGKEEFQSFMSDYGGIVNAALSGDPQAIANSILSSPKVADKITEWLESSELGDYFDIGGIQNLMNGDIDGFIKQTSMKFLDKHLLSKLDGPLGGLMSNSIMSILNGEFPTEAIMQFASQYLIKEFLKADVSILTNLGASFDMGLGFNVANIGIGFVGSWVNNPVAGFVFTKCKKKIAQDNIIHFLDMVLTFDRNKTAHLKYNIIMENENGEIVEAADENGFPINNPEMTNNPREYIKNYYPLQIFSDFASTIQDKIAPKSKEKFDFVWYEDRFDVLNIFVKKCEDRQNPFLTNCEDAVHIGF